MKRTPSVEQGKAETATSRKKARPPLAAPASGPSSPARKVALTLLETLYRQHPARGVARRARSGPLSEPSESPRPSSPAHENSPLPPRPDAPCFSSPSSLAGLPPLPVLLDEHCRQAELSARDAALTTELVHGVLRLQRRLDALLRPFLHKPEALPAWLRLLLRMAVLELFCLDRIPARATVHEAVNLARRRGGSRLAGLTNAVLRNLVRSFPEPRELPPVPSPAAGPCAADTDAHHRSPAHPRSRAEAAISAVALAGALPDWLAEMWVCQYGEAQAMAFATQAAEQPCPTWRVHRQLFARSDARALQTLEGLPHLGEKAAPSLEPDTCAAVAFGECGLALVHPRNTEAGPGSSSPARLLADQGAEWETRGLVTRQGAGALLTSEYVTRALRRNAMRRAEREGRLDAVSSLTDVTLWDACCGRGGKTCALLERGISVTLASDPSPRRVADLRKALARLRLPEPEILTMTAEDTADRLSREHPPRRFAAILLDAPCSGTGTLGRTPELRLHLTPQSLAGAEETQARLLRAVWPVLVEEGLLFYATCALNRRENEEQVAAFVACTPDAVLEDQQLIMPALPGQDALFVAVIRKTDGTAVEAAPIAEKVRKEP